MSISKRKLKSCKEEQKRGKRVATLTLRADTSDERLQAAARFTAGDRVRHTLTNAQGTFVETHTGFALPECWVNFDSITAIAGFIPRSCNPLELEFVNHEQDCQCAPNLECSTPFQELGASPLQLNSLEELRQPNLLKSRHSVNKSSEDISQAFPSMMTSVLSIPLENPGTLLHPEHHAKIFPAPTQAAEDSMAIALDSGGRCSESSENLGPDLLSGKMLDLPDTQNRVNLIALLPELSGALPALGTYVNGQLSVQPALEHLTGGTESLLLPTPMAHSRAKTTYRNPGQDKLEQTLRPHLPLGHVSHPALREWMQGFPDGWTDINEEVGGQEIALQGSLAPQDDQYRDVVSESPPLEIAVVPSKPRSHSVELSTSIPSCEPLVLDEEVSDHHASPALIGDGDACCTDLTDLELTDRHRLELKVERAFVEAGLALRELRDRRLYRDSHKTFEEYCRERFSFTYRHGNQLIAGSLVIENLQMGSNRSQNDNKDCLGTIRSQILPTKLEQVKPLTALNPDEQREVWQRAVESSNGKIPSGRIVKETVERWKRCNATPAPIPYSSGDVVMIRGAGHPELRKHDGQWAIALAVNEYTVSVAIDNKEIGVEPKFLEPVEEKYWEEVKQIHSRINRLFQCELDPIDDASLELLKRRTCFSDRQKLVLKRMEEDYGLVKCETIR